MARKPRDYKAEYARKKARAAEQNLTVRQASRMRREAKQWSDKHSQVRNSRYRPSMSLPQVRDYLRVFTEQKGKKSKQIRHDIWEYLSDWEGEEREWSEEWKSDPSA